MSGWQIFGCCVILVAASYLTGHQHGSDRADMDMKRAAAPVEVTVASPHASTCSVMLEAAWAVEDVVGGN